MTFINLIKFSDGKPMGKYAFLYTVGGNANWYNYLEDNFIICINYISRIFLIYSHTCIKTFAMNNCEEPKCTSIGD